MHELYMDPVFANIMNNYCFHADKTRNSSVLNKVKHSSVT